MNVGVEFEFESGPAVAVAEPPVAAMGQPFEAAQQAPEAVSRAFEAARPVPAETAPQEPAVCAAELGSLALCASCPLVAMFGGCPKGIRQQVVEAEAARLAVVNGDPSPEPTLDDSLSFFPLTTEIIPSAQTTGPTPKLNLADASTERVAEPKPTVSVEHTATKQASPEQTPVEQSPAPLLRPIAPHETYLGLLLDDEVVAVSATTVQLATPVTPVAKPAAETLHTSNLVGFVDNPGSSATFSTDTPALPHLPSPDTAPVVSDDDAPFVTSNLRSELPEPSRRDTSTSVPLTESETVQEAANKAVGKPVEPRVSNVQAELKTESESKPEFESESILVPHRRRSAVKDSDGVVPTAPLVLDTVSAASAHANSLKTDMGFAPLLAEADSLLLVPRPSAIPAIDKTPATRLHPADSFNPNPADTFMSPLGSWEGFELPLNPPDTSALVGLYVEDEPGSTETAERSKTLQEAQGASSDTSPEDETAAQQAQQTAPASASIEYLKVQDEPPPTSALPALARSALGFLALWALLRGTVRA